MKFYVGVTDDQWFDYLRGLSSRLSASSFASPTKLPDEVNFWQPSPDSQFWVIHIRGIVQISTFSIKEIR
jgi:hypothetical protein